MKNKEKYLCGAGEVEASEINNCFAKLQVFINTYDNMTLLSSFSEEFKNFMQRLYVYPVHRRSLKYFFIKVITIIIIKELI
jgi:hypothetical protein